MSQFLIRSLSLTTFQASQACRRYSTAPAAPKKAGSTAPWFLGLGLVGAGTYAYLERASPLASKQEKSPLDPEQWKDFKLKKIRPYNHNTSE
jgi:cytochrome-b5 reductase